MHVSSEDNNHFRGFILINISISHHSIVSEFVRVSQNTTTSCFVISIGICLGVQDSISTSANGNQHGGIIQP